MIVSNCDCKFITYFACLLSFYVFLFTGHIQVENLRYTTMNNDETSMMPSLFKSSYYACNHAQLNSYHMLDVPSADLQLCCCLLFELLKLNSNNENFNQFGERRMMYSKVQAIVGDVKFANICEIAVFQGHIQCLMFARDIGCPWDVSTTAAAATAGHLDFLVYAHENGCPWDVTTTSSAAMFGNLNCLRYALENGCPWENLICAEAAKHGHLDCLQYLHEHEFPWDSWTCSIAAYRGQLECLKYAHQNGCEWNEWTCCASAAGGFVECLMYAHQNGCLWDALTFSGAFYSKDQKCFQYAWVNGCYCETLTCSEGPGDGRLDCQLPSTPDHYCLWKTGTIQMIFKHNINTSDIDQNFIKLIKLFDVNCFFK